MRLRCFPHSGGHLGSGEARRLAGDAEHPAKGRVLHEGRAVALACPTLVNGDQIAVLVVFLMLPSPEAHPRSGHKRRVRSAKGMIGGYAEAAFKVERFLTQHRFLLHMAAAVLAVADCSAGGHLSDMGSSSG